MSDVGVRITGQDATGKAFKSATNNVQQFKRAANDTSKSVSGFRRNVGQLGFQVQDIAVQLQGGQNAMLVLGQQGSQIASIFGPGGAVIGAFLAVGAAIGTALIPKLFEAKDKTELLNTSLEALKMRAELGSDGVLVLTDRIRNLAKVSKVAAEVELGIAIIQAEAAISAATAGITASIDEIEGKFSQIENRSGRMKAGIETSMSRFREELGLTEEQAKKFRDVSKTALEEPTIENIAAFNELAGSFDLSNEKLRTFVTDLNTNLVTLTKSKEAVDQLKTAMIDIPGALNRNDDKNKPTGARKSKDRDQEQVQAELALALDMEFQTLRDSYDKKLKLESEFQSSMASLQASRLGELSGFMGSQASILQAGLGENNVIAKAAFAAQKALAIPQMIVATETAAATAMATIPGPGGIALAGIIKSLGYAGVGTVIGQTLASFDGGGFTGNGVRIGGVDGKGGRLAVMHPNEKVIDMTKSANDGSWTINLNNYAGGDASATVDEEKRVVNILVSQARNSGSPFRNALHSSSNVVAKGTR